MQPQKALFKPEYWSEVSIRYVIRNSPKQERRYNEADVVLIRRFVGLEVRDSQEVGTDDNVGDDSQVITYVGMPGQLPYLRTIANAHLTHQTLYSWKSTNVNSVSGVPK
jgi:hypothetical protein